MPIRRVLVALSMAGLCGPVLAQGLAAPAAAATWPQWQARITLQTALLAPVSLASTPDRPAERRGLQGGALLGDYYFAAPSFGGFRATSGVLIGSQSGAFGPSFSSAGSGRFGLGLQTTTSFTVAPAPSAGAEAELGSASPYLGLGFTSRFGRDALRLSAELGLTTDVPAAATGTLLGTQGTQSAWRDLRLSPLLQLGVRYTF